MTETPKTSTWIQWLETLPEERIFALLIWLLAFAEDTPDETAGHWMLRKRLSLLQHAEARQIFCWIRAFHLEDAIGYFLCREFDLHKTLSPAAFRKLQGKIAIKCNMTGSALPCSRRYFLYFPSPLGGEGGA